MTDAHTQSVLRAVDNEILEEALARFMAQHVTITPGFTIEVRTIWTAAWKACEDAVEEVLPEKPPPWSVEQVLYWLDFLYDHLDFVRNDLDRWHWNGRYIEACVEGATRIDKLRSDLGPLSAKLRGLADAEKP